MKQALQNIFFLGLPALIYAAVVGRKLGIAEATRRLGLRLCRGRDYAAALLVAVPALGFGLFASHWTRNFHGSMIAHFIGQKPTASVLSAILTYAFLATSLPEELLFRGLIGGVLFRRLSFWKANLLQSLIFFIPHVAIVFIVPRLWVAVSIIYPLGLLLGWLRERSGSIGPSFLVHAATNLIGVLTVLNWTG